MKISIDTKEDSHEEIKKVIKMLQNLVGDSGEIFTNQPITSETNSTETAGAAFTNIFRDTNTTSEATSENPAIASQSPQQEQTYQQVQTQETEGISDSTEDLFAELFSEEELKKMDTTKIKEQDEEEELPKAKGKKYSIELY